MALPGLSENEYRTVRVGEPLELRRPDGSVLRTQVRGIEYPPSLKHIGPRPAIVYCGILLGAELAPIDVPSGTEVWVV